jgi:hypothetical protein
MHPIPQFPPIPPHCRQQLIPLWRGKTIGKWRNTTAMNFEIFSVKKFAWKKVKSLWEREEGIEDIWWFGRKRMKKIWKTINEGRKISMYWQICTYESLNK